LLAISLKLFLRKLKAVATPSGLLYTDENTLAASCFRIPEVLLIDFSKYLIPEESVRPEDVNNKIANSLKPEITFKKFSSYLTDSITKSNW
jgi:hypothetical protein